MRFRNIIAFLLNLPYTFAGLITALLLRPRRFAFDRNELALIFYVKGEYTFFSYMKGWRAMTLGSVVIVNPRELENDLEHELIHVEQFNRYPFIMFWMNVFELVTKGYKRNRFEIEAYTRSNSVYLGDSKSIHDDTNV